MVKRVVVIGAESTGKTTLCATLAKQFQTTWVPEYAREHWDRKIAALTHSDPAPSWSLEDFIHIATEQQARENAAARSANRVLFCDTNAFATGTWFERYQNARDVIIDAIGAKDLVDLYLLCAADAPFVQDGVRDGEAIRDWMHERFAEQLAAIGIPYVVLRGSFAERDAKAIAAVHDLLRGSE